MTQALEPVRHGPAVRRYRRQLLLTIAFSDPLFTVPLLVIVGQVLFFFL